MTPFARLKLWWDYTRNSLWVLPTLSVVASVALASWLTGVELPHSSFLSTFVYTGGATGAQSMVGAVASSVITVTSLTFSITVVTLQLASSQFSPRLLRRFVRDPVTQAVLSVFLATFAYSLTVLRRIHGEVGAVASHVPQVAVTGAFILALASTAALVWFLSHVVRIIRVDDMMRSVREDALATINGVFADPLDRRADIPEAPDVPHDAVLVPAANGGFIRALDTHALVQLAREADIQVWLDVTVGDHLVRGRPVAWWWRERGGGAHVGRRTDGEINHRLTGAMDLGFERTAHQDVAYGLRQLVDIAVKAMSPGINDPTTAAHAVGHLTELLRELVERQLTPRVHRDEDDLPRVWVMRPSFDDFLELACGELRRYSEGEPDVLIGLLEMLRDIAYAAPTEDRRQAVFRQADLMCTAAERAIADRHDVERVLAVARSVRSWAENEPRPQPPRQPTPVSRTR